MFKKLHTRFGHMSSNVQLNIARILSHELGVTKEDSWQPINIKQNRVCDSSGNVILLWGMYYVAKISMDTRRWIVERVRTVEKYKARHSD